MRTLRPLLTFLLLTALGASACAQFTVLAGPCDFGPVQVVGETPWIAGGATRLGFDLRPDGAPLTTPTAVGGGLFVSPPPATVFQSVGVVLQADDVAVSFPANPAGLGTRSIPNSLGGSSSGSFIEPVEIRFVDPVTGAPSTVPAAGLWVADGPTNDVTATFFDGSGAVIAALPPPHVGSVFLGIAAPVGIGRILLATSNPDDFYVDDLHYGPAPFAGGLVATQTVRVGTPANPAALLPGQTSAPIIGSSWDPVIDHTSFVPGAIIDVFALGTSSANLPFANWGTILCDGLLGTLSSPAGTPFVIAIPNNCSLMSASFCAQGLSTDGPTLALTNALDITIGNL